jgi:hypothetical protein
MKNELKKIIDKYYKAFNENRPNLLYEILDDDVYLRDWEIERFGIKDVINTSSEIMNLPGFKVEVLQEIYENNLVAVDIIVKTESDKIMVVDLFKFDKVKIKSIKAFKG